VARNNPMAGGPDFIELLKNALEGRVAGFARPPATGGTQVSFRFREDRLTLLDTLVERSGWNRTQVIDALIDKGLFVLFERLTTSASDEVMESHVKAVMK
jgi:hypothetical protein